ncbi:LysR family transcriptional regulator [Lacrimispora sp.]|uniref:LysR family transcriptional regulator n=1 Tax=Lacrimispora sp. TaxID=2719234 RepID=UPI003460C4B0
MDISPYSLFGFGKGDKVGFRQYQYIVKVAELKSITKAANELYITQSSLSHYIAKIEEDLGAKIFNRNTIPISLTAVGETYVDTAKTVLSLNEKLKQDVKDIINEKKGHLTVGISNARAAFFLPYILPEFKKKYPSIEIKTVEAKSSVIEEQVLNGKCDLGILPLPVTSEKLHSEVVCREELVLVSGHPLEKGVKDGNRNYIELTNCSCHDYLLLKKGHGIRTAIEVLFMKARVKPLSVFETTSNETAYRLSTTGMGLTIVPESTILLSSPMEKPNLYSLSKEGVFWDIGAIFGCREGLTSSQRFFIELLKKSFLHE